MLVYDTKGNPARPKKVQGVADGHGRKAEQSPLLAPAPLYYGTLSRDNQVTRRSAGGVS
jgi:hypothetical protein